MVAVGVSVVHIPRKRQYGTQRLCVPAQLELKDWTPLSSMRRRNIPLIYNKTQTIIQPLIKPSSPIPVLAVQYVLHTTKALTTYNKVHITIGHRQMVPIFLIRLIAKHEHKSGLTHDLVHRRNRVGIGFQCFALKIICSVYRSSLKIMISTKCQ